MVDEKSEKMVQEMDSTEAVKKRGCFFLLGPPTILLIFALSSTGIVFTDLVVYRTCLVSLGYNSTECLMLRTNSGSPEAARLETEAEPYASLIVMTKTLIESLVPAVLSLFLGPWSDRGGRRPLLLASLLGFTLTNFLLYFLCEWDISPWYLLFAVVPSTIVGGSCTFKLGSICHISDTTTEEDRMVQLTMLEASSCSGLVLGILIGPMIYANYGYSTVFTTAAICSTAALVYVYVFISETVQNAGKKSTEGPLDLSLVKDLLKSSFVKREGFNRSVVWLGILTFTVTAMIAGGYQTIGFLFSRARLGWDVSIFSYYASADFVLRIGGMCLISLITPLLGLSDTFVAGIALLAGLGGAITKSLVWQSWHMYLSVCIEMLAGFIGPNMRSIISKAVPVEDVGKVFSVTALLEALAPLGGSPLFTLIYSKYLPPIYPSPVYMVSTSIYALLIICVIFIHMQLRKSRRLSTYVPAAQTET